MTVQATIKLNLDICGPFLCSGTAPASWGFDATFDRDYHGRPYIDRSHIKGKLREAMKEIGTSDDDLNKWFGKTGPMENGSLFFSDLRLKETEKIEEKLTKIPSEDKLHRIAMDNERRVVKPNALQVMENAFPGGSDKLEDKKWIEKSYIWTGEISYAASATKDTKDTEVAKKVFDEIHLGLKWMTRLGAEKGIGFGRLKSVNAELMEPLVPINLEHSPAEKPASEFTLTIKTDDVLLLGDIRIKESNYQESMEYITGNAIKGALAQALNTVCGVASPATIIVDEANEKVKEFFPKLAKYFSAIRFTHAFPSKTSDRPVVIPYSIVSVDGTHHDVALHKNPIDFGKQLPAFQTDWKDGDYPKPDVFGWATPLKFAKTRTAIDGLTRRAEDGKMFTYQYICPCAEGINAKTGKRDSISWIGGVYFDHEVIPKSDCTALQGELECALNNHLQYLGKRASRVKATIKSGAPQYKPATIPRIPLDAQAKKMAIVVLQSDALMVKAKDLLDKTQTAKGLDELYKAYWLEITKDKETGKSCCELLHFFAMQKLRGGFLRTNILKRNNPATKEAYYPYYLTEAGSVFVLEIKDSAKTKKLFDDWRTKGLPLPDWAETTYGKEVWRQCPYVPENGYGEVIINMDVNGAKVTAEGGTKS